MYTELQTALFGAIGAGVGSFAGAYLNKRGELLALKEEFAELLRQLEAQTRLTEGIKTEMSVLSKQKETRFSKWHGKQAEVLTDLYVHAVRAEEMLRPTIPSMSFPENHAVMERKEQLRSFFEANRLYVPTFLDSAFDDLLNRMSQLALRLKGGERYENQHPDFRDALPELTESIGALRGQLQSYLMHGEVEHDAHAL